MIFESASRRFFVVVVKEEDKAETFASDKVEI